jgi:hypothetical protein
MLNSRGSLVTQLQRTESSPSKEIARNLRHQKFQYRIQNSLQSTPILSEIYPVHGLQCFFNVRFNSILPSTPRLPGGFFLIRFPSIILHALPFLPMRAPRLAHLIAIAT